ncbi:MAG: argininosuccinate lyase [Polyangiales bacterium]
MSDKAWGGRFSEDLNELAAQFSASVDVDKRLAREDIQQSIAHATMLATQGIIEPSDRKAIVDGLNAIANQIESGKFDWDPKKEDVHMNIESSLTGAIGDAGGKLHTGRSRNDQVATDMRLWTRTACDRTASFIDEFLEVLVERATDEIDVLMPGYTHLQRAQPVRLSHHLMAWAQMLRRDRNRMLDARRRLNESPLGCAALAGTTFPLDRDATATALGFDQPMQNSLDAVGDRDFLLEVLSALSITAVHLSRISEELVLWSSQEFGFIDMGDAFTTGSSIMPQKKNPDMAELVRGKTGRVVGALVNLLITLKGLPLAYNRDLQEDKAPVFDAFDTVDASLRILAGAVKNTKFHADAMNAALSKGFLDATEVADFLASKGLPFRQAHHVAGNLVALAISQNKTLGELSLDDYKNANPLFDDSIYNAIDMKTAVERRNAFGGTSKSQVSAAIQALRTELLERRESK